MLLDVDLIILVAILEQIKDEWEFVIDPDVRLSYILILRISKFVSHFV
jgi:hypothetical protein